VVEQPLLRVRELLAARDCDAVVLTRPSTVAWVTGGANAPIDRGANTDVVWAVVTATSCSLITTEVEKERLVVEALGGRDEWADVVAVPWWDEQAFIDAARAVSGARVLATDGHPAFELDLDEALTRARLVLSTGQQEALAVLGRDAAEALQTALLEWSPGETDRAVQARVVALLEGRGADTPVVIVGGDDRVRRYRHPLAVGAPMSALVMAVVVARRAGLHVAATRMASRGALGQDLQARMDAVRRIESRVLSATTPGATYGDALGALDSAYADEGYAGEWRRHYQGGPIGYRQREFEISPAQRHSSWGRLPVHAGHAVAWNPSVGGGAKVEDTYLVGADSRVRVTDAPGWPVAHSDGVAVPAILEVDR